MISILLPFRNAADTLDAAITSMAQQHYRAWELVLIDNGSTDESLTVAEAWCAADDRMRLLTEPQVGIAHALNAGLDIARQPYIARMDADDLAHPKRLEKQLAFLEAHPEIGVLGTRTTFETTMQKHSGMAWFVKWQNALIDPHAHFIHRFVDAPLAHPTVLFRRDIVERFGNYATTGPEDLELWLRWMHHGVRMAKLPEELLVWRDHDQRASRTDPNYSAEAFDQVKCHWLAKWLKREHPGRPVLALGTSALCQRRAAMLRGEGIAIPAFSDVKPREVPGFEFIPHIAIRPGMEHFVVSFISQRGTGDRIAAFLEEQGLVNGEDFLLAA